MPDAANEATPNPEQSRLGRRLEPDESDASELLPLGSPLAAHSTEASASTSPSASETKSNLLSATNDDQQGKQHFLLIDSEQEPLNQTKLELNAQTNWQPKQQQKKAQLAKQESIFEREDRLKAEREARKREKKKQAKKQEEEAESAACGPTKCCGRWWSRWCCCWCLNYNHHQIVSSHSCKSGQGKSSCQRCKMLSRCGLIRKCLIPLLLLVIYALAIYCLPFANIQTSTVAPLPVIPFNYLDGPLKPSSASAFKIQHLFKDQLHGPESLAFDSQANLYMAVEGGFILYAHLNRSSPIKRAYLEVLQASGYSMPQTFTNNSPQQPLLIKIAELNGPKQVFVPRQRSQRDNSPVSSAANEQMTSIRRRECQLDEQIYGQQLYSLTSDNDEAEDAWNADNRLTQLSTSNKQNNKKNKPYQFKSRVRVSRCSKPLGLRLSQDESSLYVIDTLSGLYRVNLKQAERPGASSQRQVIKLIDFKANNGLQLLPAISLNVLEDFQLTRFMNVSMRALDDLVIDFGAGTRGGDMIYMTVASQVWPAVSFVYDHLEGRPSGLVLRYDTGTQQLMVLEPVQLAHVRNSNFMLDATNNLTQRVMGQQQTESYFQSSVQLGAPRLDENDLYDDRPLNFPNGLELMDDRQALLIADTSNKRILKHWIRGPRRGTSDLWAWTPQYPDNIRRGYDKQRETYWVVGCGRAPKVSAGSGGERPANYKQLLEKNYKINSKERDMFSLLHDWPRVRKFALKQIYMAGALVEFMGAHVFKSVSIQDYGYELKTGSGLCSQGCLGMMVLQYNQHGDVIRSIHSREFPNDLTYYSQVNELIDGQQAEHSLYLGSPSYNYLTKLILPTETRPQIMSS